MLSIILLLTIFCNRYNSGAAIIHDVIQQFRYVYRGYYSISIPHIPSSDFVRFFVHVATGQTRTTERNTKLTSTWERVGNPFTVVRRRVYETVREPLSRSKSVIFILILFSWNIRRNTHCACIV